MRVYKTIGNALKVILQLWFITLTQTKKYWNEQIPICRTAAHLFRFLPLTYAPLWSSFAKKKTALRRFFSLVRVDRRPAAILSASLNFARGNNQSPLALAPCRFERFRFFFGDLNHVRTSRWLVHEPVRTLANTLFPSPAGLGKHQVPLLGPNKTDHFDTKSIWMVGLLFCYFCDTMI